MSTDQDPKQSLLSEEQRKILSTPEGLKNVMSLESRKLMGEELVEFLLGQREIAPQQLRKLLTDAHHKFLSFMLYLMTEQLISIKTKQDVLRILETRLFQEETINALDPESLLGLYRLVSRGSEEGMEAIRKFMSQNREDIKSLDKVDQLAEQLRAVPSETLNKIKKLLEEAGA